MKDKLHIRFLWLLVPFLAASCIYLFLYQYNNKYTRTTIQPANGLLILSEKELQTDPVRFLKSGWSFYPDQLLSPEDFSDGIPDSYHNAATFIPTVFQTVPMDTALMCSGFLCLQSKAIRWNCRRSSVHAGYMWMISWC